MLALSANHVWTAQAWEVLPLIPLLRLGRLEIG
jgi:hypothetical protein